MALLLALVVGIAAQSLVGVAGGIHELASRQPSASEGHAAYHLAHEQEAPAGLGGHAASEGCLHVLLHHGPCTHGAWMAVTFSIRLLPTAVTPGPLPENLTRIPSFTPSTPFRPPIAA